MPVPAVRSSVSALSRCWRRPAGLVEQTRWLFCLLAVASTLLLVPALLDRRCPVAATTALVALSGLVTGWVRRYRRRRTGLAQDLVETGLFALATASAAVPAMVLGAAFPALWARSVYGTGRQVARHALLLPAALAGALPLWSLFPRHDSGVDAAAVLGSLPVLLLTAAGARHLAVGLFARERSQQRDAVVNDLGLRLLAAGTVGEVHRAALAAGAELCRLTPGLWTVLVTAEPDGARLEQSAGDLRTPLPPVLRHVDLPATTGPVGPGSAPLPVRPGPVLAAAVGEGAVWHAYRVPGTERGWLLVGVAGRGAAEAVPGVRAVLHLAALAAQSARRHRDLAQLARTDALTGLANRAAFTTALEECERDGVPVGVVYVDLDRFKEVNDTHGHAVGDGLLRAVAGRLRTAVRAGDLCARLGGDEFTLLLLDPAPGEVEALHRRVAGALTGTVRVAGATLALSASSGAARSGHGESAEAVVHRADEAMYRAKHAAVGRGGDGAPVTAARTGSPG
ncbi:diguanylate cyclase domain-containing protein [Kineococcus terrestris]|uniref:diguanylate cyclase domain-containing protein n=1 Tax=Kineococcus terrestris TaxID=2044856 RepID=UPI0034DB5FB9